jgi:hypothetical protein
VALLNFAPFVGPMVAVALLVVVGFSHFETPLAALSVPGVFLALHLIEGQLVTPLIVGRRLALDPVMVFLALILFGWLWGVAGLLLAMPLLDLRTNRRGAGSVVGSAGETAGSVKALAATRGLPPACCYVRFRTVRRRPWR